MTRDYILIKLERIIKEKLQIECGDINPDSNLMEDINMSSFDMMLFISSVEEEFNFKFNYENLRKIITINDIVREISKFIKENKERDKLLILGSDSITKHVLNYCKENNIYTIISDSRTPDISPVKLLADEYWLIDYSHIDELEKRCVENKITGVFAGAVETALDNVRLLTKRLNLPFYASDYALEVCRNKALFKEKCKEVGLPVPAEYNLDNMSEDEINRIEYPVIVKPVDSYCSYGVSKCNNKEELDNYYKKAKEYSLSNKVLVEQYIEGRQVMAFYILNDNKPILLGVTDCDPCNIENGRSRKNIVATSKNLYDEFIFTKHKKMINLFKNINAKNGVFFVQAMRRDDGECFFIDPGYRLDGMGGWLSFSSITGFNSMQYMVNFALNKKVTLDDNFTKEIEESIHKKAAAGCLLYCKSGKIERIENLNDIGNIKNCEVVFQTYKEGDTIPNGISMKNIISSLCVTANSEEEAYTIIEELIDRIRIYDENGNDLLLRD